MTRPTKEDVDEALRVVTDDVDHVTDQWERVLAGEVVALREELAAQTELVTLHKIDAKQLRKELAVCLRPPHYSTEAVDALLAAVRESVDAGDCWTSVADAADAVRASRVPPLR